MRLRVSSALKRVAAERPQWLVPYLDRLLTEVLGDAPALLWVLHGNERAEAFYRRHGFQAFGAPVPLGGRWGEHAERLYVRR